MNEHTNEPWCVVNVVGDCLIYDAQGTLVETFYGLHGKLNARRIVACVNACAGIPTGSLEDMPPRHLDAVHYERDQLKKQCADLIELNNNLRNHRDEALDDAKAFCGQVSKLTQQLDETVEQRDDLARLLLAVIECGYVPDLPEPSLLTNINEALASVKESK